MTSGVSKFTVVTVVCLAMSTHSMRTHIFFVYRKCFFRTNKVLNGGVSKFIEELNQLFESGVLMCEFDSSQLRMLLKEIMKSYFR